MEHLGQFSVSTTGETGSVFGQRQHIDVLNVLFTTGNAGFSTYSAREPSTQLILDKLERRASLDALAGLIALTLEAHDQKMINL